MHKLTLQVAHIKFFLKFLELALACCCEPFSRCLYNLFAASNLATKVTIDDIQSQLLAMCVKLAEIYKELELIKQ